MPTQCLPVKRVLKMHRTALLLIDVQRGFDNPCWGKRNNDEAEENIASLLALWRSNELPVVHVRHASDEPNSPLRPETHGYAYKVEAMPLPCEKQFEKRVNNAFIGTGLEGYLRGKGVSSLVIAGFTTDHCVSTSTRMAGNLGFNVTLVSDGTATFERLDADGVRCSAEEVHRINLASLNGEFCTVCSTDTVIDDFTG